MKTQLINGLTCTISYRIIRDEDGGYECKITCKSDGSAWSGVGATKKLARESAETNMRDELTNY